MYFSEYIEQWAKLMYVYSSFFLNLNKVFGVMQFVEFFNDIIEQSLNLSDRLSICMSLWVRGKGLLNKDELSADWEYKANELFVLFLDW